MGIEQSNETDPLLRKTLRAWEVKEGLPPRFQERVWQRIARRETRQPAGWWSLLSTQLAQAMARPVLATSYIAVLLAAGLLAGYWQGRVANAHASEQLSARYVQVMDPYQMPQR
jgi:hypothetical protein